MVGRSIALLAVLRAAFCAQAGGVQGRVADIAGASIPNAVVELQIKGDSAAVLHTTKTDWPGHFSFMDVTPGTYELHVSAPGFEPYTQSMKVMGGQEIDLAQISLVVAPIEGCDPPPPELPRIDFEATKSGETLLDGAIVGTHGEYLAGVTITLSPIGKNTRQWTMVTGSSGSFSFSGITPGMYTLRATRRGYSDFLIDRLEIKVAQHTHISEALEMLDCPDGFRCNPNRRIHVYEICL